MSNFILIKVRDRDLNKLTENTLRSHCLEEMQNYPREEYFPTKGISSEKIKRYACSLYTLLMIPN